MKEVYNVIATVGGCIDKHTSKRTLKLAIELIKSGRDYILVCGSTVTGTIDTGSIHLYAERLKRAAEHLEKKEVKHEGGV